MQKSKKLFWECVDQSGGPDACWPWLKGHFDAGYGVVVWGSVTKGAHVVAFELAVAPVPKGLLIRHSCDNRPCCNPKHLSAGTQKQNYEDAKAKDRHSRGERQGLSKLTDEAVTYIRENYVPRKPGFNTLSFAKQFGVSQAAIWFALKGSTWKHPTC